MTPDQLLLIAIIFVTLALILWNKVPTEITALGVLLTLWATGLVDSQQALSGFSSNVVITLVGLFVITGALEATGIVRWIARGLDRLGKGSEERLIVVFMTAGAAMSLIMNNVAAGAVLLPAAIRVADTSDVKPSKLLLPMSFGTLLGGMATYLTTANIIMSELLREQGLTGLNMLSFLPTGGIIVLAGILYMVFIGRSLLPERDGLTQRLRRPNLQRTYQLSERLWRVIVLPGTPLASAPIPCSDVGRELGMTVMTVKRNGRLIVAPKPDFVFALDDEIIVLGREQRLQQLIGWGSRLLDAGFDLPAERVELSEVLIAPRANAIGQTLAEIKFRKRYGLTPVAIWREGRAFRTDVRKMRLQVGDALLVLSAPEAIKALQRERDFIVPRSSLPSGPTHPDRAVSAGLITLLVLGTAIADILPLPAVMLTGAIAMLIAGCIDIRDFYGSISWSVIFLIAGILPLSIAIADSGLAELVGAGVVTALSPFNPLVLVAGMWLLTVAVAQIIGGQVTALLVGPIAITAALQLGISPQAISVAVAIGCSTAFLTPIAHPVNLLMMGPGGYEFSDFFKVGAGMTVVVLLALLLGMWVLWGVG